MRDPRDLIWFMTREAFKAMPFRMTLCAFCAFVIILSGIFMIPFAMYLDHCANQDFSRPKPRLRIVR